MSKEILGLSNENLDSVAFIEQIRQIPNPESAPNEILMPPELMGNAGTLVTKARKGNKEYLQYIYLNRFTNKFQNTVLLKAKKERLVLCLFTQRAGY